MTKPARSQLSPQERRTARAFQRAFAEPLRRVRNSPVGSKPVRKAELRKAVVEALRKAVGQ